MNPTQGLKVFAMPDPLAKGFTRSQINDLIYQLTADPEQSRLMMEAESLAVLDAAYIKGESVTRQNGFILDAVTTSYARFPRAIQALERALNRFLSSNGITVIDNEIGEPKKNNLFATIAVQFTLSDGQAITIVFHAPDEDPKVFKPDDVVIAFRWLLNKRDITQAVTPEMGKGKAREVSLPTIAKRLSHLVVANSEVFQVKQKEVTEAREHLAYLQEQSNILMDELNQITTEISILEERNNELDHIISIKSNELAFRQNFNNDLRTKIAELKIVRPEPEGEQNSKLMAILTLENIINGLHDNVAADGVLEMIEEANYELEKLGLIDKFDALIGSAVEKYVELDEKQE
ncbi:hypothetical protein [Xenorhabdus sp. PB30.3]|uniref:defense against restriction DarA-related protein n=1 Tax=Xenorhabdus sp. PB30.3 TaxID=2788941 RepID=UPI001E5490B9|nr:hypothetical protein [Xenorhabdus sp. PB30.3]MCC8380454.1 hypothetical protein [Xenorhabdus sp. PB30.3]